MMLRAFAKRRHYKLNFFKDRKKVTILYSDIKFFDVYNCRITKNIFDCSMIMKYQIMGAVTFVQVSNSNLTTKIIAQTICHGHDLNQV